jgi:Protein of unknown function (DUF3631)
MTHSNAELDAQIIQLETGRARLSPVMDGAEVLNDVCAFLGRFIAYPSEEAQLAHTLWIAHTHLMDAWESTPRLAFLSPEPGSGKTRALEITELLVPNAVENVNMSPAYLFRRISAEVGLPTLLIDEVDALFGNSKTDKSEEIRALLNAGHRRGATVGRCVMHGKTPVTEESPSYCAVALAGLNSLPDTLMSRSVVIRMRRRAPGEKVEPYRRREHSPEGEALRDRLAEWADSIRERMAEARPGMPQGVEDRSADVWEPLLAIADATGGHWPEWGRSAAVKLVAAARESSPSLGILLLGDLRQVFGPEHELPTECILERLNALPESPWGNLKGKPLDDRGLAQRLRKYEVRPKVLTGGKRRGYRAGDLRDVWDRYLAPPSRLEE